MEAPKHLDPVLLAWSLTVSGISTLSSLNKDLTESNTPSLDLLVFVGAASNQRLYSLFYIPLSLGVGKNNHNHYNRTNATA